MSHHKRPFGVGLAYRAMLHRDIMKFRNSIDLLEIPTEDYVVRSRRLSCDPDGRLLTEASQTFPCLAHGISLSIGTVEEAPVGYLERSLQLMKDYGMEVFSDHLTFHRCKDVDLTMFLALPFEEIALQWLERQYYAVREVMGRPFALENVTYPFPVPGNSMTEAEFLCKLTERTDCSLLIDVTNIYNNACNHGYDAKDFVRSLPGERVSQLHLAGGHLENGVWIDSHSHPVMDPVWELLEVVLQETAAEVVIVERDSNFHPFQEVVADVEKAREIFYRHRSKPEAGQNFWEGSSQGSERPVDDPVFRPLKAYQEALMRAITDADFWAQLQENPESALSDYPLGEWKEKILNAPSESIEKHAERWRGIRETQIEQEESFRRYEWQLWAHELRG